MNVLGISCFYHDSAACLVVDGEIRHAAQEERFSRLKHDAAFPSQAARWCLRAAGLEPADVDLVAFYDRPLAKLDRILETHLAYAPRGFGRFRSALPTWMGSKLAVRRHLARELGIRASVVFPSHHESHAASAFYPSPFVESAILTVDGVGEWTTASIGRGDREHVELLYEQRFPHSLGLLYSAFTAYCGFRVNDGEYKLMGLAPYGRPRFVDAILSELVDLRDDGSLALHMEHFAFGHGPRMFAPSFTRILGGPARAPGSGIDERMMDVARSIQEVTEEAMVRMARHARALTGARHLAMAGGVALNCVANGRIQREAGFDEVWVQPAAGDAGSALGAALFAWHRLLGNARTPGVPDGQRASLLGPSYDEAAIEPMLLARGLRFRRLPEPELVAETARLLASGAIVGHFAGAGELGPRALGNRSLLADPRPGAMRDRLNADIKGRESFRPFAPAVLASRADELFELGGPSPYMLFVSPVAQRRRGPPEEGGSSGQRPMPDPLPATTHVDGTARVQTVDAVRFPRLHAILEAFDGRTGVPALVNTSFNVSDEPIVNTPEEAVDDFLRTGMDALVLETFLMVAQEQDAPRPAPYVPPRRPRGGFDWDPDISKLRTFGLLAAVVFGGFAVAAGNAATGMLAGPGLVALGFGALGTVSALCSWVRPTANRLLWRTLGAVTLPVRWVLSWLLVATLFFVVVTPLGLLLRALGRDGLALRRTGEVGWKKAEADGGPERYLRRY